MSAWQRLAAVPAPVVSVGLAGALMLQASRWGLIDHREHRKVHDHPTPLVGGLAMLLTLLALLALLALATLLIQHLSPRSGTGVA